MGSDYFNLSVFVKHKVEYIMELTQLTYMGPPRDQHLHEVQRVENDRKTMISVMIQYE